MYNIMASITNYIVQLMKENRELREENKDLREAITYLHTMEDDNESVASYEGDIMDSASDSDSESDVTSKVSEPDVTSEVSDSEPDVTSEVSESDVTSEVADSEPDVTSEVSDSEYFSSVNYELSHLFTRLAVMQDNPYKKNAYIHAAQVIKDLPYEPTDGQQLKSIEGIGPSIIKLINEYMDTGSFKKLE